MGVVSEALPCPFCGGEAGDDYIRKDPGSDDTSFWVVCDNTDCNAEGPLRKTPEEAIEAWNTRMTPGEGS
jgi:Lar family restriction alleviation protein